MTVKELRELLNEVDDDSIEVLIPVNAEFDGLFRSPCMGESGLGELPIDEEDDEMLGETKDYFLILPHGFGEHDENEPDPQMN